MSTYLIPNPPTSTGEQTLGQATHAIFLPSWPHPKRNLACVILIILHTVIGALKKDRQNIGSASITNLIKHTLPAIDTTLPFYVDNLDLILSITGIQNATFLGFPPILTPKYLNGNSIWPQFRRKLMYLHQLPL